jgi:hypothetical protein
MYSAIQLRVSRPRRADICAVVLWPNNGYHHCSTIPQCCRKMIILQGSMQPSGSGSSLEHVAPKCTRTTHEYRTRLQQAFYQQRTNDIWRGPTCTSLGICHSRQTSFSHTALDARIVSKYCGQSLLTALDPATAPGDEIVICVTLTTHGL